LHGTPFLQTLASLVKAKAGLIMKINESLNDQQAFCEALT